jgi:phage tail-like protein
VDVNGTRFHLLLSRQDWLGDDDAPPGAERPGVLGLSWEERRGGLILQPEPFRFPPRPGGRQLDPSDRRGAARDRFGNWYWIGDSGTEVRILRAGAAASTRYWPAEDQSSCPPADDGEFRPAAAPARRPPRRYRGLVVTEGHHLVVGALDLPGLLIFDLWGGGPPVALGWPGDAGGFAPLDMAPAACGGVWVLDQATGPGTGARLWKLGRGLEVVDLGGAAPEEPASEDFERAGGDGPASAGPPCPVGRIRATMAVELDAVRPVAVEGLPDDSVLVLDQGAAGAASTLHRYRCGTRLGAPVPLTELVEAAHDIAFLPARDAVQPLDGGLYVADRQGDQAFLFDVDERGGARLRNQYLPMRLFGGKGLVASGGYVWYDLADRWVPVVNHSRPSYGRDGALETVLFDGREPACVWHRLFLDGCIPPGTEVAVQTRAGDDRTVVPQLPWQDEPRPYLRQDGAELPYHRAFPPGAEDAGTFELLFQRARGRYLQVRLTLTGTQRDTPRLVALRVHYPRFSYLAEYLPDVYREQAGPADFLDRYLANLEGQYTVLEDRIANAQVLFDVRTLAADYLDWLAGWLGVVLEDDWDEARRRLLLAHAVELFGRRGTLAGLVRAIRLATDLCPGEELFGSGGGQGGPATPTGAGSFGVRVVEQFLTRRIPGRVLGDPTAQGLPRLDQAEGRWRPQDGAAALHQRFGGYLADRYGGSLADLHAVWGPAWAAFDQARFPPLTPQDAEQARDWLGFVATALDIPYAEVGAADRPRFRDFLAQRYRRVADLAAAYGGGGGEAVGSFDAVELPDRLPSDGRPLHDWLDFVANVLPIARAAHRFVVLVPVRLDQGPDARDRLVRRVERVVAVEKPAHTSFQVKPYWAAFLVGQARVGLETVLGEGSRFVPLALGSGALAGVYTGGSSTWEVAERVVVGRDRVRSERATASACGTKGSTL